MLRMKFQPGSALLAGMALLLSTGAQATTLRRMTLDEMTATATVVARVRCTANEVRADRGEIWTFTSFETVEALKGAPPVQFRVRLIGGRLGSLKSTVDGVPRFRDGEELILFLEPSPASALQNEWTVVSWVQGTFRVHRDPRTGRENVTQDTSGLTMFDAATQQFAPGGVRNLPLAEFKQSVAAAANRGAQRPN